MMRQSIITSAASASAKSFLGAAPTSPYASPHSSDSEQMPILHSARSSNVFVHASHAEDPDIPRSSTWPPGRGQVIYRIYPAVLLHTFFAAVITYINECTKYSLEVPNVMLTVLGLVVGFGIATRASQGFDRFNTGRSKWTDLIKQSRTLGRLVWDHVPQRIDSGPGMATEDERELAVAEKRRFIGLIEAFAVSTKHALRGEEGIYWEDLFFLVSWLPIFHEASADTAPSASPTTSADKHLTTPPSPGSTLRTRSPVPVPAVFYPTSPTSPPRTPTRTSTTHVHAAGAYGTFSKRPPSQPLRRSGNVPARADHATAPSKPGPRVLRSLIFGYTTISYLCPKFFPPSQEDDVLVKDRAKEFRARELGVVRKYHPVTLVSRQGKKPGEIANLPLLIIGEMSGYIACLDRRGSVPGAVVGAAFGCLAAFEDSLGAMEQILTTPPPVVYSVHLRQTVWIYLLALPVQLVGVAGWFTVPVLTIASFLFLGFLAAGEELSQPFGWDENDIDLDLLCGGVLRADLEEIMSRVPPPTESKQWFVSAPTQRPQMLDVDPVTTNATTAGGDVLVDIR